MGQRTERVVRSLQESASNLAELEQELERLYRRRDTTNWTALVLLLIGAVAMAAGRYL